MQIPLEKVKSIPFKRVHRIPKKTQNQRPPNRPRPVIARFSHYKDKEFVQSFYKNLNGTNIGFSEDFPKEVEDIHKALYPILKKVRQNQQQAYCNFDTPHMLDTPHLYFHSLHINSVSENDTQALLQLQVDSGQVTAPLVCKIDTGAEGNVIPVDIYKCLCPQSSYSPQGAPIGLTPSNTIIAFRDHTIPHYGICELSLSHHGHTKLYAFHVVNTVGSTILGLPTCCDMKLVTLNHGISTTQAETASMPNPQGNADARSELLCQYQDCFQGIGCFQGEFHITLEPTVPPVIHPPCT